MAQRPEELVELLPEAERFLAREAAVGEPAERAGLVLVHDLAGDFDAAHAGRAGRRPPARRACRTR